MFVSLAVALMSSPEETPPSARPLQELLGESLCRELGVYPIPPDWRISVVVPVYNERATLQEIVRRIRAVPIAKEIILVDDGSSDGTRDLLATLFSFVRNTPYVICESCVSRAEANHCHPTKCLDAQRKKLVRFFVMKHRGMRAPSRHTRSERERTR